MNKNELRYLLVPYKLVFARPEQHSISLLLYPYFGIQLFVLKDPAAGNDNNFDESSV